MTTTNTIVDNANRITELFRRKENNLLSVYFTAGFPELNSTKRILVELQNAGVDLVEVGIPFSDPLADGPVIQHSGEVALKNGMNLKLLFEQLRDIRNEVHIPVILMGYINPVLQFGMENFLSECNNVGVDGVILPDLPLQEFENNYRSLFLHYCVKNVFLVTPQTSHDRIKKIDDISDAFIYLVALNSTTGVRAEFSKTQLEYFERIKSMQLKNPTLIGFGISSDQTFAKACEYSNGAIIGSAFINALEKSDCYKETIKQFVSKIKKSNTIQP